VQFDQFVMIVVRNNHIFWIASHVNHLHQLTISVLSKTIYNVPRD
jgi:hypothetical protein